MIGIYSIDGTVITKRIESAVSMPDTTKVEKKLLSGRYVIQTIGTAGALLNVTAYANMQQKNEIDRLEKTGAPIIVVFDDVKYTGLIKSAPISERIMKNVFHISFTLNVNEQEAV